MTTTTQTTNTKSTQTRQERRMAWTILVIAALLEPVWAIALERSDGFRRLGFATVGVVAATASFVLLSFSLRHLPVGTAYAVWVGIGATCVAAMGMLLLDESTSPLRLGFLTLIVVGVAGLRALDA
jgi:quaternary ammonium compound-resistance protein SugE